MTNNDRSLSNRNRSGLSNERGIPHNSLSLDAFYQKAKKTANRFVVGLKEYFDFLVHGDAEIQGDVNIDGDLDVGGKTTVNNYLTVTNKTNPPSAGDSVEILYDQVASRGYIQAYDRDTSSWKELRIRGNNLILNDSGGGDVLIDGGQINKGGLTLGDGVSTSGVELNIGSNRTASGNAIIDMIGDTTYTAYGLRLIRNATGANTNSEILHRGTGQLQLRCIEGGNINMNTSGNIVSTSIYNSTTGSASNVYIESNGILKRSTSSIRYKKDIEPMADEYIDEILKLSPIYYRPKDEEENKPNWSYFGFLAEDVAKIDPRFVDWEFGEYVDGEYTLHETPRPAGVFYDRLTVPLIGIVKDHENRIKELELEIERLKDAN